MHFSQATEWLATEWLDSSVFTHDYINNSVLCLDLTENPEKYDTQQSFAIYSYQKCCFAYISLS